MRSDARDRIALKPLKTSLNVQTLLGHRVLTLRDGLGELHVPLNLLRRSCLDLGVQLVRCRLSLISVFPNRAGEPFEDALHAVPEYVA